MIAAREPKITACVGEPETWAGRRAGVTVARVTGRLRHCAALVALALVLGVIASLLGASAGARFTSVPAQGHDPTIVRGVVTDAVASVPRLPRLVLPNANRLPAGVGVSAPDLLLGGVAPAGLLLVTLVALATVPAPGRRARTAAVMSALPRRAPPISSRPGIVGV